MLAATPSPEEEAQLPSDAWCAAPAAVAAAAPPAVPLLLLGIEPPPRPPEAMTLSPGVPPTPTPWPSWMLRCRRRYPSPTTTAARGGARDRDGKCRRRAVVAEIVVVLAAVELGEFRGEWVQEHADGDQRRPDGVEGRPRRVEHKVAVDGQAADGHQPRDARERTLVRHLVDGAVGLRRDPGQWEQQRRPEIGEAALGGAAVAELARRAARALVRLLRVDKQPAGPRQLGHKQRVEQVLELVGDADRRRPPAPSAASPRCRDVRHRLEHEFAQHLQHAPDDAHGAAAIAQEMDADDVDAAQHAATAADAVGDGKDALAERARDLDAIAEHLGADRDVGAHDGHNENGGDADIVQHGPQEPGEIVDRQQHADADAAHDQRALPQAQAVAALEVVLQVAHHPVADAEERPAAAVVGGVLGGRDLDHREQLEDQPQRERVAGERRRVEKVVDGVARPHCLLVVGLCELQLQLLAGAAGHRDDRQIQEITVLGQDGVVVAVAAADGRVPDLGGMRRQKRGSVMRSCGDHERSAPPVRAASGLCSGAAPARSR
ncbi:hypothetical protein U1Q18_051630 [Sarracenia purpurea var. burkii]